MSRSPAFLMFLLAIFTVAVGPTATAQDARPTARVIVKLREPLAREVESSLPASLPPLQRATK